MTETVEKASARVEAAGKRCRSAVWAVSIWRRDNPNPLGPRQWAEGLRLVVIARFKTVRLRLAQQQVIRAARKAKPIYRTDR